MTRDTSVRIQSGHLPPRHTINETKIADRNYFAVAGGCQRIHRVVCTAPGAIDAVIIRNGYSRDVVAAEFESTFRFAQNDGKVFNSLHDRIVADLDRDEGRPRSPVRTVALIKGYYSSLD